MKYFRVSKEVWNKIIVKKDKALKIGALTFVFGIFLYFPMITKWLTNPDGVWNGLLYKSKYGWEDSLGRFGLGILARMKGYFIYPSLQTIGNLLLVACIAVLLMFLFDINSARGGVIGALLVCSPSLCSTLTYYYTSDAYIVAYLFSVLFVVILAKTRGKTGVCISIILFAGSMSLYQAYIGTAITLCLTYILFLLLKRGEGWRKVLKISGRFLTSGIGAIILYLLTFALYCHRNGISPEQSRGFDRMGRIPLNEIYELVLQAYKYFFDYFLTSKLYNNDWHLRGKCNAVILILLFFTIVAIIIRKKIYQKIFEIILVVLGVFLLPLAFMSIVVMAPQVSIEGITGILMLPHMNYIYIFLIVLTEEKLQTRWLPRIIELLSAAVCVYMIIILGLYIQIYQNCMEYEMNRSYAIGLRIVSELEDLPQHSPGMKLIISGRAEDGNYPRSYPEMYAVTKGTAAEYGFFWDTLSGSQSCWNQFLRQYVGVEYSMAEEEELEAILNSSEYGQMPLFPYKGSVVIIDGIAVVKLS